MRGIPDDAKVLDVARDEAGRNFLWAATTTCQDGIAMDSAASDALALVLSLYHELLQRDPGSAELEEWKNTLLGGLSQAQARAAFIASDEYRHIAAATKRKQEVMASGLFDADWYLATYRDVAAAGLDPLEHYCRYGNSEQRMPNAYFDDPWYRRQTGLSTAADALLHYVTVGERAGIPPGPHFDPAWYRIVYRLDEQASPLAHFLANRMGRSFAPSPRLWAVARPDRDAAVRDATDPFQPHLMEGLDLAQMAVPDIRLLLPSGLFDANHYQVANADVLGSGMDPLTHFCVFGWKEGRNPNPYFNSKWYVATNPEVARLQVNPLVHYLLVGESNDRRPVVYFEPAWYRRTYGLGSDDSPLAHYLAHRRTQRFSPNSLFDPAVYLRECGEPLGRNRDPFAHYLVAGMQQDLRPSAAFDAAAWRRATRGRPTRYFRYAQWSERDNPLVNYLLAHYR